jgi:hypothetical protein
MSIDLLRKDFHHGMTTPKYNLLIMAHMPSMQEWNQRERLEILGSQAAHSRREHQ